MATYYENVVLRMACGYFEKTYESNFFLCNAVQYWIGGTGRAWIVWCAHCVGGRPRINDHCESYQYFLPLLTQLTHDGGWIPQLAVNTFSTYSLVQLDLYVCS